MSGPALPDRSSRHASFPHCWRTITTRRFCSSRTLSPCGTSRWVPPLPTTAIAVAGSLRLYLPPTSKTPNPMGFTRKLDRPDRSALDFPRQNHADRDNKSSKRRRFQGLRNESAPMARIDPPPSQDPEPRIAQASISISSSGAVKTTPPSTTQGGKSSTKNRRRAATNPSRWRMSVR